MLHFLKLKLKLHLYSAKKIIIISVASNLSFFTFNTKNNTNILHINIIYEPVEYYVIISAKNEYFECRELATASLMGNRTFLISRFVNFVVYYFELFGTL